MQAYSMKNITISYIISLRVSVSITTPLKDLQNAHYFSIFAMYLRGLQIALR